MQKKLLLIAILWQLINLNCAHASTSSGLTVEYIPAVRNLGIGLTNPNTKLTINGNLAIKEGSAPSNTSGFGKLYTNSTNHKLYFLDQSGTAYNLTNGSTSATTDATTLDTFDSSDFLRSNSNTTYSSGTFTVDSGTTVDINSINVSIADPNISFDSASGVTFTPTSGQNLNIALATTGDFAVNTNQLYVDTSTAKVGINKVIPAYTLDVNGTTASKILNINGNTMTLPSLSQGSILFAQAAGTLTALDNGASSNHKVLKVNGNTLRWEADSTTGGDATTLDTFDSSDFLRATANTTYSSGTFTVNSGTTVDINSAAVSIADNDISFDSASGVTFTPTSGQNLNIALATTGDFAVNTNQLYVDTSATNTGLSISSPNAKLTVNGAISIKEGSAPSNTSGFGKLYTNSSNHKLYYVDQSGTATNISNGAPASYWSVSSSNLYPSSNVYKTALGHSNPDTVLDANGAITIRKVAATVFGSSSQASNGANATSLYINKPSATVENDLLIMAVSSVYPVNTPPSGWTLIEQVDPPGGNPESLTVYYKIATNSEPANYGLTFSSSAQSRGVILRYTNVDTSSPIDAHGAYYDWSSGTAVTPSITTSHANTKLLRIVGLAVMSNTFNSVAGYNLQYKYETSPSNADLIVVDKDQSGTGATGTTNITYTGMSMVYYSAVSLAINSASNAGSSSDPSNPDAGSSVLWMASTDSSSIKNGDLMSKVSSAGTTKTIKIIDFTNGKLATTSNADKIDNLDSADFLRSNANTTYSSGTFTVNSGTTVDINSTAVSIADNDISFDSASGVTFTPTSGQNLNIALATTGDFAVNTNQLYVDTSATNTGLSISSPNAKLTVNGAISIKEGSAPSNTSGFGKLYTNSSNHKLYYVDQSGTATNISNGAPASYWSINSNDLYTSSNNYNVGIGLSSPDSKLDVAGAIGLREVYDGTGVSSAVVYESSANSGSIMMGTTATVSKPSGTVDGNLLIAIMMGVGSSTYSAPAGWTQIEVVNKGSGTPKVIAWYRVASSEPSSYNFTAGSASYLYAYVLRYSGVDTSSPINASATVNGTVASNLMNTAGVTTNIASTKIIKVGAAYYTGNTPGNPSGYTSIASGTASNFSFRISDLDQASAGSSDTNTMSFGSNSYNYAGITIALAPTGSGVPAFGTPDNGGAFFYLSNGSLAGANTGDVYVKIKENSTVKSIRIVDYVNGTVSSSSSADTLDGIDSAYFLRSNTNDNFTSGVLSTDSGTRFDVNGDLSIADTNIALDGASSTLTSTGAMTFASGSTINLNPATNSNINFTLGSAGDFAVNTNQLYVDTSTARVGVNNASPSTALDVTGTIKASGQINGSTANVSKLLSSGTVNGTTGIFTTSSTVGKLISSGVVNGTTANMTKVLSAGTVNGTTGIFTTRSTVGKLISTGVVNGTTANFSKVLSTGTVNGTTGIFTTSSTVGKLISSGVVNGTTANFSKVLSTGTVNGTTGIFTTSSTVGKLISSGVVNGTTANFSGNTNTSKLLASSNVNGTRLTLAEGSAPGTPGSGSGHLYVNSSDSKLYFINDGGTTVNLSDASAPAVGGSNTHFQFNDNNSFAGNGALSFDKSNKTLSIPNDAPLDINSTTVSIADNNISFDSASGVTFTPTSGQNLNITLATTGDFTVNTNQLYVDTSAAKVGINNSSPSTALDVTGTIKASGQINGTTANFSTGSNVGKLISTGTVNGTTGIFTTSSTVGKLISSGVVNGTTANFTTGSFSGTTSTSKLLASSNVNGTRLTLTEGSAPSTPGSGYGHLYVKSSDSKLYFKNDAGTETDFVGSGSLNIDGLTDAQSDQSTDIYLGYGSGTNDPDATITYNTALGIDSLHNTNNALGGQNTAVGYRTLYTNTSGGANIALGYRALYANTTGGLNIGIGGLQANTSGNANVTLGGLQSNTSGLLNVGIGVNALENGTTGNYNTAVGTYSLDSVTINGENTAIGYQAGVLTKGNYNTFLGSRAGDNLTTGNSNIIIGYNVDAPSATASNQLNIGNTLYGDINNGNVGIGSASIDTKLEVNGASMSNVFVNKATYVNTSGTSVTINWNNGNKQEITLGHTVNSLSFTAPTTGVGSFSLFIIQDGSGNRTISSWPASVKWPGGTAPTLSTAPGYIDIISCIYRSTNYYCQVGLDFR